MIEYSSFAKRADCSTLPTLCQCKVLRLLNEAWIAAQSQGQDVWQFAVEIDQLRALGISNTDLRCLLGWGYLEHARECTTAHTRQRMFQALKALILPKRTCFVLTGKGREAASEPRMELAWAMSIAPEVPCSIPEVPRWDSCLRQLMWKNFLIKEFRVPAANQETVLHAMQEDGWPPRMDDPLPCKHGLDPKVRLHETIKALNRNQQHALLRFRGDGTGKAIYWEARGLHEDHLLRSSSEPIR